MKKCKTGAHAAKAAAAPTTDATPPSADVPKVLVPPISGCAGKGWTLPAMCGVQAGRTYYVAMVPVRHIYDLLPPVDPRVAPEERAQRALNMPRVHKLVTYLVGNMGNYTLPPLVGLIDGIPTFEAMGGKLGILKIPEGMKLATLDGQHRRAALQLATRNKAGLKDEDIPVVLFVDVGLEFAQQRFADLNGHAARPARSLSLLFDHRGELSALARAVVQRVSIFAALVDGERTTVSGRSAKLFPFAAVHAATKALLAGRSLSREQAASAAVAFWQAVAAAIPSWGEAAREASRAAELRAQSVVAHGVALEALGRVGNAVLALPGAEQAKVLAMLASVDWKRTAPIWEGRAVVNGRMVKNGGAVILTANAIKREVGIDLSPDERECECRLAAMH